MRFQNKNIIYNYDGGFDGFLCCAFESFTRREIPADIVSQKAAQPLLLEQYFIETDAQKAERVKKFVKVKIGRDALEFLEELMFARFPQKEIYMLQFLRLGYKNGAKTLNMLAEDAVDKLIKAAKFLRNESHLFKGFIRFSVHGDILFAKIKPKNFVLPFIAPHFAQRFQNEKFLIYDETNKALCAYSNKKYAISEVLDIDIPKPEEEEIAYQKLWKMFYENAAVDGRINPKCRMTNMPKRYWGNLTEFYP
ncbi:MAG: TIGR03915 family putative DNA repair protein [Endomicrobium sp.]|nr:TIGR03915 family putative DNA repair protein [Endomicrobium sp.]